MVSDVDRIWCLIQESCLKEYRDDCVLFKENKALLLLHKIAGFMFGILESEIHEAMIKFARLSRLGLSDETIQR